MMSPLVMLVIMRMVRITLSLSNSLSTRLKIDSRLVGTLRAGREAARKGGNMDQGLRTESPGRTAEPLLAFTDKAVEMIKPAMQLKGVQDGGVRMTGAGGGCKGFQYSLNLEPTLRRMMRLSCRTRLKPSSTHPALNIYKERGWIMSPIVRAPGFIFSGWSLLGPTEVV